MAKKKKSAPATPGEKLVTQNRRARHDYTLGDRFEAGLVLKGSEVKSLREGHADLKDSYVFVRRGEAFLSGCYIGPYAFARDGGHEPEADRKLLLHKREIERIRKQVDEKGVTLVPLRLYFTKGKAKLEFAIGRGKQRYDKRQALKERTQRREMDRAMRRG